MTRTMLGFAATAAGSRKARTTVATIHATYHVNTATAGVPTSQLLHASVALVGSECLAWQPLVAGATLQTGSSTGHNPSERSATAGTSLPEPGHRFRDSIAVEVRCLLQGGLRGRFACLMPDSETNGAGSLGRTIQIRDFFP